ncbi:hypothetical protein P154DRAFT_528110, partial [Amniculicola lignicola CBS 123094]
YLLINMRYKIAGREYTLWDGSDFEGWTTYDLSLLPCAIRRELLLAYAEHRHYPRGKANCTRGIVGPLRARREKE